MNFEKRVISLRDDQKLEVTLTEDFKNKIMNFFDISSANNITDDHIRMFIWGSVNNAVERFERETAN